MVRKNGINSLTLTAISLAILFCFPTIAISETYTLKGISGKDAYPSQTKINASGQVVWRYYTEDANQQNIKTYIMFYDGSETTQLSNAYGTHYNTDPEIGSNGHVVWMAKPSEIDPYEINLYDGHNTIQLSNNINIHNFETFHNNDPLINKSGFVVWRGNLGDVWYLYLYDGEKVIQIPNSSNPFDFHIDDKGQVVFKSYAYNPISGGNDCTVVLFYNGTETIQLTDNTTREDYLHMNASGHVVWSGRKAIVGGPNGWEDGEIYLYDGQGITQLTDNDYSDRWAQIGDNGLVAWARWEPQIGWYMMTVYDGKGVTLLPYFMDGTGCSINASDKVVWQHDWNVHETYVYDHRTSVVQRIDGGFNTLKPYISDNGQIVMALNLDTGFQEIVLATPEGMNAPPIAVAGENQSIHVGIVSLDGSGSYDDMTPNEELLFDWSFVSVPEGSNAKSDQIIPPMAKPSFIADVPGEYLIQLIVTDTGGLKSTPSMVTVTTNNTPPNANAGLDRGSYTGNKIPLDGSASNDPDGDPLTFIWTLVDFPTGNKPILTGADTATPSFIPLLSGNYTLELIVHDGYVDSSVDTVNIAVFTPEDFAQQTVANALNIVSGMPKTSFTTQGNQTALGNFMVQAINLLTQAVDMIQDNKIDQAKKKIIDAIERTDGCALRGTPDQKGGLYNQDYISNCNDQSVIYPLLSDALLAL